MIAHRRLLWICLAAIVIFVGAELPWSSKPSQARLGAGALLVVAVLWSEDRS